MDGVLIDSEPHWNVALIEGFAKAGLAMTAEMAEQTMGARLNEVVDYWTHKYDLTQQSAMAIEADILAIIKQRVKDLAPVFPGVNQTIKTLNEKGIPLAIASSSPMDLIQVVLDKLDSRSLFSGIFSAADDIYGKPHPSVYLRTAKHFNVLPEACWVMEDSVNGMVAAKAAKMNVIVVPDPKMYDDDRWSLADLKLSSMLEFKPGMIGI